MRYCDSDGNNSYDLFDLVVASGYEPEDLERLKSEAVWSEWAEGKSLPDNFHLIIDGEHPNRVLKKNPITDEEELVWDESAPLLIETLVQEERDGVIVFRTSWLSEDPDGDIEPFEGSMPPHVWEVP